MACKGVPLCGGSASPDKLHGADLSQEDLESSATLRGLPISLSRIDVHAEWVSPAVLGLMGDLPDHVEGGQIVRDDAGKPTGVFVSGIIATTASRVTL